MKEKIDRDRVRRAAQDITVKGNPVGRGSLIAEAIAAIETNGKEALSKEYFGIKNYEQFGDQREDHRYGYGPKHGCIVFRIGRTNPRQEPPELGPDHIYLLECVRDFGIKQVYAPELGHNPTSLYHPMNLIEVIQFGDKHAEILCKVTALFDDAMVETHSQKE